MNPHCILFIPEEVDIFGLYSLSYLNIGLHNFILLCHINICVYLYTTTNSNVK